MDRKSFPRRAGLVFSYPHHIAFAIGTFYGHPAAKPCVASLPFGLPRAGSGRGKLYLANDALDYVFLREAKPRRPFPRTCTPSPCATHLALASPGVGSLVRSVSQLTAARSRGTRVPVWEGSRREYTDRNTKACVSFGEMAYGVNTEAAPLV